MGIIEQIKDWRVDPEESWLQRDGQAYSLTSMNL